MARWSFFGNPVRPMSIRKFIRKYLEVLDQLSRKEIVTAGYVDKPRSDLVIRLLELAHLGMEKSTLLAETGLFYPLLMQNYLLKS